MVDNLKLQKYGATHLPNNVDVRFIFRLVLRSSEDVKFNSICLNLLEGINQLYEGQSKITESWLISFYWVGSFG